MRTYLIKSTFLFLMVTSPLIAQQQVRISGFVKDKISGESLIGANIVEPGTGNGTMADYNGYFSIMIKTPSSLQISFLGYKSNLIKFEIKNDTLINVFLFPAKEQLI